MAARVIGSMRGNWPSCYTATSSMLCTTESTGRSEEHTSELQSLRHLVCRLLLEKKKYLLDLVGLVLLGTGISLLSSVLEVCGEHTLSGRRVAGRLPMTSALLAFFVFF